RVLVGADQDAEARVLPERLGERAGVAGAQAPEPDAVAAEIVGDGDGRHAAEPTGLGGRPCPGPAAPHPRGAARPRRPPRAARRAPALRAPRAPTRRVSPGAQVLAR